MNKDKNKKKIVVFGSSKYYDLFDSVIQNLIKLGFDVIIPSGYNDSSSDKNLYHQDIGSYMCKMRLLSIEKIKDTDYILFLNYDNGKIGGSSYTELVIGGMFNKPIFILNQLSKDMVFYDDILGFNPVILNNNFELLRKYL